MIAERVINHQIHGCLTSLLQSLEEIQERWSINDTYTNEIIERANYAVAYIQKILENADPLLVSTQSLDHISNIYNTHIAPQIAAFKQNQNIGHIHNIDPQIMIIIQAVGNFTITKTADDVSTLRESITSFRRSISQQISKSYQSVQLLSEKSSHEIQSLSQTSSEVIEELRSNATQKLDDLTSEITAKEDLLRDIENKIDASIGGFDSQLSEYSSDISTFMSEVRSDYQTSHEEWNTSLEEKNNDFENMLKAQQEVLETTLQTASTKLDEHASTELNNLREEFVFLRKEIDANVESEYEKIKELWGYLESKKSEVEVLAGKVAVSSMAGHYKLIADREEKSEVFWKKITSGVFLLLILITSVNAYLLSNESEVFSLGRYLPKVAVELVSASFLWFCLRQITIHRKHERYNRQIHLELASLEPYTASLGDEVTNGIKKSLAEKLFGRAEQMIGISSSDDKAVLYDQDTIIKLLEKLGSILKK